MANLKVVINRDAIRDQLLRSPQTAAFCEEIANGIAGRASKGKDDYGTKVYYGRNRVNVSVSTTSAEAVEDNLKNNTLLRSMQ